MNKCDEYSSNEKVDCSFDECILLRTDSWKTKNFVETTSKFENFTSFSKFEDRTFFLSSKPKIRLNSNDEIAFSFLNSYSSCNMTRG